MAVVRACCLAICKGLQPVLYLREGLAPDFCGLLLLPYSQTFFRNRKLEPMALKVNVSGKHSEACSRPDDAEPSQPPPPSPHDIQISVVIEARSQTTSNSVRGRKPTMFRYVSSGRLLVILTSAARDAEQVIIGQLGWQSMNPDAVVTYPGAKGGVASEKLARL